MDNICVTFEEWYIGDGTYPPLHKGQKVNLSFYIQPSRIELSKNDNLYLIQKKNSDYLFSGKIIRVYSDSDSQIIIVDTGFYKFYIENREDKFSPSTGQFIEGEGQLIVDYYVWVENLSDYANAPDIFYNLIIERLLKVKIPEKFIYRHDKGFSSPTSLLSSDYSDNDLIEIIDMRDNKEATSFYLLDLKIIDENVPMTFI
jgi:hypothetical protein